MNYAFLGPDGCSPAAILTLEFKYMLLTRSEICVSILGSLKSQNHITSTFFSDINAAGSIYILMKMGPIISWGKCILSNLNVYDG